MLSATGRHYRTCTPRLVLMRLCAALKAQHQSYYYELTLVSVTQVRTHHCSDT